MGVEGFKPSGSVKDALMNLGLQAGLHVVEEGGAVPSLYLDGDLRAFARSLAAHCASQELFRDGENMVFIDHEGERALMTADIFRTWINGFIVIFKKEREINTREGKKELIPIQITISGETANAVLKCDVFAPYIRKVIAFNAVRLPVKRASGDIELLPLGYDEESRVYTRKDALPYSEDKSLDDAVKWFNNTFGEFPFHDERSRAVVLAGMHSLYVKHLLPEEGVLRPGFLFYANKAGSGKSILAKSCLYPVMGHCAVAKMKKGSELDKELEAFSIGGVPYIFLDNVYGSLKSASLDQMLTSAESVGRVMGGQELFRAKNKAQIFITGNNLELNEDAQRRFLIVDLLEKGEVANRKITNLLDESRMRSEVFRAEALSSLWSFVRSWRDGGQVLGKAVFPSFEAFSRLIGGIITGAGYACPIQRAELLDETNPDEAEFKRLLYLVGLEMNGDEERWTAQELAKIARANELLESKVGSEQDGKDLTVKKEKPPANLVSTVEDKGYLDPSSGKVFGSFLGKKLRSQFSFPGEFVIEFGERSQKRKATYTIKKIPHNEPF